MPSEEFYDSEFGAEPLRMLTKRDLLASSNPVHRVPLAYNLFTKAEEMEGTFQRDRKENPLFETTPPEIWIVAEIMPLVKEIRANVGLSDRLLGKALQRYLRREAKPSPIARPDNDKPLVTTIGPYVPGLKKLLIAVCDRQKSLREILRLPASAYTIRDTLALHKPSTKKQEVFLLGIKEGWSNHRIAKRLDDAGLKPRRYKSYNEMLRVNPHSFESIKSNIKKTFR